MEVSLMEYQKVAVWIIEGPANLRGKIIDPE